MNTNPNIVFIFTDQQRYDSMSVYGNDFIKVPNMNRLAEQSAVFKRTYVTQPVCTPSRATMITGLYPHSHGLVTNNLCLDESNPSIAKMLKKENYKTAYIGKWHLGNEVVAQHGFDKWVSTEDYFYRKYFTKEEYKSINCDYHHFLVNNGFMPDREDGDYGYFSRMFATRIPERYSKPAFIAQKAEKYIKENKDDRFLMYVNFLEPHPPYYSVYDELYDPDGIPLPPNFDLEPGCDTPVKYKEIRDEAKNNGRHFPLEDEKAWRKQIARYWGAVSLVDKYLGRILDSLRENGIEENTIVVFTSDHGDLMGDFGMIQKSVIYESSARVPMLIKIPGITDDQIIIDEPVSQIDLVPTLLDTAGCTVPVELQGRSLLPVIEGRERSTGNDVFIEWYDGPDPKIMNDPSAELERAVVTQDCWKLSLKRSGENELYDLNTDPKELINLYYLEKYKDMVKKLSDKIFRWQKKTGDDPGKDLKPI